MISKGGFAHLEGQKAPKTEPGRVPNRAPEATPAEGAKTQNLEDVSQNSLICMVPGPPFGSKNGTKTEPKRGPNRYMDVEGAGKAS